MTNLQEKFILLENSLTARLDALITGNQQLAAALVAIGACLCEDIAASVPGGDEPLNPPPTEGCTAYERVQRVQSWQFQANTTISGTNYKIWAPIFTYAAGYQGWRPHTIMENGKRAHIINQNYNPIFYCITWNFTGGTLPVAIYRDTSSSYDGMVDTTSGLPLPNGDQATGSYAENFPAPWLGPGNPDAYRYIQFPCVFPESLTIPPLNIFLRYNVEG